MSFTLAIIGRPNVGKSTLFNRLVGKRLALVDDRPGVTRDLREGEARLGPLRFTIIDTAGLEEATDDSLPGRMRRLTERAMAEADACLFLIDARAGVTALDRTLAEMLRKADANVILAANKCEGRAADAGLYESFELGLGEPVGLSAEHGEGMGDLLTALEPLAEQHAQAAAQGAKDSGAEDDPLAENRPLQIAITGRPNAGKSTLVNTILGDDRLLTGPEAGLTRDAISVPALWGGRRYRMHDTAGLRKKAKVQQVLDRLSSSDALRAIRFAEVVVLLMEADQAFETQDLRIADLAAREGRAIVLALSKWDLVDDKPTMLRDLREKADRLLPQLRGAPVVPITGLTGEGLDRLESAIRAMHATWNTRVATSKLNDWLAARVEEHPPPAPGGRRIRMRFMTQVRTRPPGFVVMCSRPDHLPDSYSRYLVQSLRRDFGFGGVPLRLHLRKPDNPYAP
ncbi:MAG: ribosome biogenesis GTPase Der [Pseudomonadota bacterium]